MTQEEFFTKIKEVETNFNKVNPCSNCIGNVYNACRGCEDKEINYKMRHEIKKLKDEYKELFGKSYDDEVYIGYKTQK